MQVKLKFGPSGSIFDRVIILELRKKPNKNSSVQTNVTIKRHLTFWLLAGLVPPSQLPNEYYFQL